MSSHLFRFKQELLMEGDIAENEERQKNLEELRKIASLKRYIVASADAKLESILAFQRAIMIKDHTIAEAMLKCQQKGKRFYSIPESMKPKNKAELFTRDEAVRNATRGRMNDNTTVILFDDAADDVVMKNVCFGYVMSQKKDVTCSPKTMSRCAFCHTRKVE